MIEYIILGIVQGLTEFLPISSSGHLVLLQDLFKVEHGRLIVDIVLHAATLSAVVVFLRRDIADTFKGFLLGAGVALRSRKFGEAWRSHPGLRLWCYIGVVTVITGVVGVLGENLFEQLFASSKYIYISFLVTGAVLLSTKKFGRGWRSLNDIGLVDALLIAAAQSFAIIPGISRSGMTIASSLFRGVKAEEAFKFSFLISLPAIAGALLLKLRGLGGLAASELSHLLIASILAFVSGLIALSLLRRVLLVSRLWIFGFYCIAIAVVLLWGRF